VAFASPERLFWLPPPPEDFRKRLKALPDAGKAAALRDLAGHSLEINQLIQLDRALDKADPSPDGTLSPVRLAYLSDATTDYIAPAIAGSALRHGIHAKLWRPDFGLSLPSLLQERGELAGFAPELVLLAFDHRALGLNRHTYEADAAVDNAIATAELMLDRARALGAQAIAATIAAPPEPWCGHLDRRVPGSVTAQIAAFNDRLTALVEAKGAILFDVAGLAETVGRARWHNPVQWNGAKQPFDLDLVPLYADHVARILGAVRGRSRKCLVLDLDNTLWGGIIGDDGLEGIALGSGSPRGEAHHAIQNYALALKARGIVLAICSKNEEDAARLPFTGHPEMLIKEADVAVFVANWEDKATNLARIAKTLNIGTDALVFLDDNPAERARVRQMLPEVAVPEVPEDPAWYPAALAQAGYFETIALSADDLKRAEQYRANAERAASMESLGDIDAYHRSLEMVCSIAPFDEVGRARITQLINKSNQYNVTTRRYTEAEVAATGADPNRLGLQVRLTDRFGDNGMISVVIFDKAGEEWLCDTWLMSCRVLGRRVEEAVLDVVVDLARAEGVKRLRGDYIPTAKNRMVTDHFARLQFEKVADREDGGSSWVLDLDSYKSPKLPMTVVPPVMAAA